MARVPVEPTDPTPMVGCMELVVASRRLLQAEDPRISARTGLELKLLEAKRFGTS